MKTKIFYILAIALLLTSVVTFADRTDTWINSSVIVDNVHLQLLNDGGCRVIADGRIFKTDGGMSYESSQPTEVSGANRTTCLDIIQNKAPILFKADRGL